MGVFVLIPTCMCTLGDLRKGKQVHRVTLRDIIKMKCGLWGLLQAQTVAVCLAHTPQVHWGWFKYNISSPTWHSFGPFLVLWATRQSSENTPVRGTKIPTSHYPRRWHIRVSDGSRRNEYLWVLWSLLCNGKPGEITPPCFCCVCPRVNPRINGMK